MAPDISTQQGNNLENPGTASLPGKRRHSGDEEQPNKRLKLDPSLEFAFLVRDSNGELFILKKLPLEEAQVTSWAKQRSRERGARFFDKGHRVVAPQNCFITGVEDGSSTIEMKEPPSKSPSTYGQQMK
ncbi:hypothetical protein BDW75DRAFT_213501 [Aspergillus navahoensis]